MRALLASLLLFAALPVMAQTTLSPEEVEARTDAISKTLRCVVCQNQTLNESSVPLALDMKALVQRRVEAGDTDAEVRAYMVERYGDFVLMKPPVKASTWALWGLPFMMLGAAAIWFAMRLRRRAVAEPQTGFTAEERALIDETLQGGDET